MIRIPVTDSAGLITSLVFAEPVSESAPAIGNDLIDNNVANSYNNSYVNTTSDMTTFAADTTTLTPFETDGYHNIILKPSNRTLTLSNGLYIKLDDAQIGYLAFYDAENTLIDRISISSTAVFGDSIFFPALSVGNGGVITDVERIHIQKLTNAYQIVIDRFNSTAEYEDALAKWNTLLAGALPESDLHLYASSINVVPGDEIIISADKIYNTTGTKNCYLKAPENTLTIAGLTPVTSNGFDLWTLTKTATAGTRTVYNFIATIKENVLPSSIIIEATDTSPLSLIGWTSVTITVRENITPPENESVGGNGSFNWESDTITGIAAPSTNLATTSGVPLIRAWLVNTASLNVLHAFMWDPDFFDVISGANTSVLDAIISLHIVPWNPTSAGPYDMSIATHVINTQAYCVTEQFTEVNCGYIDIAKFYDSWLDYNSQTKITIVLPFIGERELDTNMVMGKRVQVKYICDSFTGNVCAEISADGNPLYCFDGNAMFTIPVSGRNFSSQQNAFKSLGLTAVGIAAGVATGSAVPAMVGAGALAGAAHDFIQTPDTIRRGNLSVSTSMLGFKKPFIKITSPNAAFKNSDVWSKQSVIGTPNARRQRLGDCSGFTKIEATHIKGMTATNEEKDLIMNLLKEGVEI